MGKLRVVLESAARHDSHAGVRAEFGRANDPLYVQRLFLEFVERHLVDVGLADDLEDLLVDPRAVLLDLGRDGDRVMTSSSVTARRTSSNRGMPGVSVRSMTWPSVGSGYAASTISSSSDCPSSANSEQIAGLRMPPFFMASIPRCSFPVSFASSGIASSCQVTIETS